jgi:hypothetical protein
MEAHFRSDLSHVRINDGPEADEAARSVNAHAFALGPNIFFARGQYAPQTREGQYLLAHELAHVTQQDRHPATAYRQVATPGGPSDNCKYLFSLIKGIVVDLKERIEEALIDRHGLFKKYRSISTPHPDSYGSWDGHKQFFEKRQQDLQKARTRWLTENCNDDDFDGGKKVIDESEEYAFEKEFPSRPDPSRQPPSMFEKEETGIPKWVWELLGAAAAAALIACFATGVCEIGWIIAGLGFLARSAILWALEAAGVIIAVKPALETSSNASTPSDRSPGSRTGPDADQGASPVT